VALSSGAIMTTVSWTAITVLFLVSLPFAWGAIHFEAEPYLRNLLSVLKGNYPRGS
jgi:hypothetical protein